MRGGQCYRGTLFNNLAFEGGPISCPAVQSNPWLPVCKGYPRNAQYLSTVYVWVRNRLSFPTFPSEADKRYPPKWRTDKSEKGGRRWRKRGENRLIFVKAFPPICTPTRRPPIPLSPSAFFAPFSCPPISSYFLACLSSSVAIFRPRLLAISPFKNEKKAASYFFCLLLLGHQKNFSAFKKRTGKSKKVLLRSFSGGERGGRTEARIGGGNWAR